MCVDGLGYVYVCESYVVLDQCDEPPPCLCVSDAVYVDLKYDDVFVLWLIVVCEWVVVHM